MSRFVTKIPVDVQSVTEVLPEHSYIASVSFDPTQGAVLVVWDHDRFQTPFTFALEFPAELLADKKLPRGVVVRKPSAVTVVPTTAPKAVDRTRGARGKGSA